MESIEEVQGAVRKLVPWLDEFGVDRVRLYRSKTWGWVLRWKENGLQQFRQEIVVTKSTDVSKWLLAHGITDGSQPAQPGEAP